MATKTDGTLKVFRVGLLVPVLLVAACSGSTHALKSNRLKWTPPAQGVIRDGSSAISMARIIWFSMNPSLKKSPEELWQSNMTAKLVGGVWRIREKSLGRDFIGGGLEIDLNASNGKVVRVILIQ